MSRTVESLSLPSQPTDLEHYALLLDVDGTLLDIAEQPMAVIVPDSLRDSLVRVRERAGGALALVSGRPVGELDLLFAPLKLAASGGHGAQLRFEPDSPIVNVAAEPLTDALVADLRAFAASVPGIVIENKRTSIALHFRQILDQGLNVVDSVFAICSHHPPEGYELLTGKAVLEVKSVGFSKGTAVRELMQRSPFAGRTPIFIGDDITDEAAFEAMPEFDGLAISVGRRIRGAAGTFETPQDVRDWLARIATDDLVVPSMAI